MDAMFTCEYTVPLHMHSPLHAYQSLSFIAYTNGGKTFCLRFLRANFRNQQMLLDEILIELLHTDIVLKGYYSM